MELVDRVQQLELELLEFQESSKELELALEDELARMEAYTASLEHDLEVTQQDLATSRAREQQLERQLEAAEEAIRQQNRQNEERVLGLTQRLVAIEVVNESMELNDRMHAARMEVVQQMNNDLLERVALLDDEVHRQRDVAVQNRLHMSNQENTILELSQTVTELQQENTELRKHLEPVQVSGVSEASLRNESTILHEGDVLVLSMRDMLRAGPQRMSHSGSLHRLQELLERSMAAAKEAHEIHGLIEPEKTKRRRDTTRESGGRDKKSGGPQNQTQQPRQEDTKETDPQPQKQPSQPQKRPQPPPTPAHPQPSSSSPVQTRTPQTLPRAPLAPNSLGTHRSNPPTRKTSHRLLSSLRALTKAVQQPVK